MPEIVFDTSNQDRARLERFQWRADKKVVEEWLKMLDLAGRKEAVK